MVEQAEEERKKTLGRQTDNYHALYHFVGWKHLF